MLKRATIDELAAWLKIQDDFVIIGHIMPDGDAMGSCIAMMLALRSLGKRAFVCLPGGGSKLYAKYPFADEVVRPEGELPFAPKTALSLDVSEPERLGAAKALFDGCEHRAAVDHHPTNPGFGELFYLDGEAAATGEIVLALIRSMNVALTKDIAQWLYIAICTDCGQFGYSNTRPETMMAAAELMKTGIDTAHLVRDLYHTFSRARTQLAAVVLAELEVSEDGRIAWARLTQEMLRRTGATREDNEGIVNQLLDIAGVEIAFLAEERDEGTKFSLRSKERIDVAYQIAVPLGGGGHARAAGCTLSLPMEAAIAKILEGAKNALTNEI